MPASKDTKKTMDVSKPGQSAPDSSARPVIVTHRPMVQDPMVKDETKEDTWVESENTQEAAPKPDVPHGDRVIQPLSKPSGETETAETPEPEAEAAPADSPADPVETEDAPPESSPEQKAAKEAATVDAVAEQVSASKKKSEGPSPEEKAKQEAWKKLVADKKYFVSVGRATHRRNTRRALVALVAVLILGGLGFLLLIDAGMINAGFKLPFDLIKNTSQDSNQNVPAPTPAPVTETKKAETKAVAALTEYKNEDLGITFKYPKEWREFKCEGSKSVAFLIFKEDAKCATEDRTDGPSFYKDEQGYKACNEASAGSEFDKTECKEVTIGTHKVLLVTSTYIKEGPFGEPIGSIYYQYYFLDSDLAVAYSFWPSEKNQKGTVEEVIKTITFNKTP